MLLTLTIAPRRPLAIAGLRKRGRVQRPKQVGAEETLRFRFRRLEQRLDREMRGVVDENVGGAEASTAARHNALGIGFAATSAAPKATSPPSPAALFKHFAPAPRDQDLCAAGGEGARDRKSDARPPPGNDHDFTREFPLPERNSSYLYSFATSRRIGKPAGASNVTLLPYVTRMAGPVTTVQDDFYASLPILPISAKP